MATINSTASGGNWSAGGSWVGGVAPGSSDTAVIVNGATITITSIGAPGSWPTSTTVNSGGRLTVSAANALATQFPNLTVNSGGRFTLNTDFVLDGTCTLAAGSTFDTNNHLLIVCATMSINCGATWSGGGVRIGDNGMGPGSNTGTLTFGGTATFSGAAMLTVSYNSTCKISNGGWLNYFASAGWTHETSSVMQVEAGGRLSTQSPQPTFTAVSSPYPTATLTMLGTLDVDIGGQLVANAGNDAGYDTVNLSGGTVNVWGGAGYGGGECAFGGTITTNASTRIHQLNWDAHLVWAGAAPAAGVLNWYIPAPAGGGAKRLAAPCNERL